MLPDRVGEGACSAPQSYSHRRDRVLVNRRGFHNQLFMVV